MKERRPPVTPLRASKKRSRRRNPGELEQAAALSEDFHGRPARKVTEIEEPANQRTTLADLGLLRALHVEPISGEFAGELFELSFDKGTHVNSSPDGRQIYLTEGDQSVDLDYLGLSDEARDHVTLGLCHAIVYLTRKGFDGFKKTDYIHEFGEDGGAPPTLHYDSLNRRLYFSGGTYTVKPEGITN